MPKGVESNALAQSGTNFNNAQNIYGSLMPTLQAQAAAPPGYTGVQKAAMNTAAQQSAGGSNAAAVGMGALRAARTRNAGTADAAIADSARTAGQRLSDAAVGTEVKNAGLQQQQRQQAMQAEEGLYAPSLGASTTALGIANNAAQNNPWMSLLQTAMQAGGKVGAAALGG